MNAHEKIVQKVLMEDWDPIGIKNESGAQDEYDSYIPALYKMITSNRPRQEMVEYLLKVEQRCLGFPEENMEMNHECAGSCIDKLVNLINPPEEEC